MSAAEVDALLNKQSGFLGLAGGWAPRRQVVCPGGHSCRLRALRLLGSYYPPPPPPPPPRSDAAQAALMCGRWRSAR